MSKLDKLKSVATSPVPYAFTTAILMSVLASGGCTNENTANNNTEGKTSKSLVISPTCTVENACNFATDGGHIYSSKEAIKFEKEKVIEKTTVSPNNKSVKSKESSDFCRDLVVNSESFTTKEMQKQLFESCNDNKDTEITFSNGFNQYCKSVVTPVEAKAEIKNRIYVICYKTFN